MLKSHRLIAIAENDVVGRNRLRTYRFNTLMEDGFMDEVELAELPDELDVSQHLDLGDGALLLLLGREGAVLFVVH